MTTHNDLKKYAVEYISKKLDIDKVRVRNGGTFINEKNQTRSADLHIHADDKNRWWTSIAIEIGILAPQNKEGIYKRIDSLCNNYSILVWFPYHRNWSTYNYIGFKNPHLEPALDDIHGLHSISLNMKNKLQCIAEYLDSQQTIYWFSKHWESIENFVWVCPDCYLVDKVPVTTCFCKMKRYTVEEQIELLKKEPVECWEEPDN